jgi:hypothetical protein
MKFCRDCKFYDAAFYFGVKLRHQCQHPSNAETSMVTGETRYTKSPETMRVSESLCGSEARHFEAKQ